ncbi:hypothetical protein DYQ86_19850 [Acidobacteria bacterium AB60]|nr:hypothetical protein DYQ86_19850 [Acidobacteria bacterium AB60]
MLATLVVFSAMAPPAQPLDIHTSGWCSPVFVNVKGPVSVTCKGVDPQANAALNQQLSQMKTDYNARLAEANQWAERYHKLARELKQESSGSELARQAEQLLHQGKLDQAVTLLKQIHATQDKQNIDNAARHDYEIGLALEMEFKSHEALSYLEEAQQIRPNEPEYACEFARVLQRENRLPDAQAVYARILPKLEELEKTDSLKYERMHMLALQDAAGAYAAQGDFDKAQQADSQAFAKCMALGMLPQDPQCDVPTLSGIAADIGAVLLRQGQFEQAEQFFTTAFNNYKGATKDGMGYLREQAEMLTKLGMALEMQENFSEAERVLQMATSIEVLLLDRDQPDVKFETAATAGVLALVETSLGKLDAADHDYSRGTQILDELAQQEPDAYLPTLESMLFEWADGDARAERFDQAKPVLERVLPIDEKLAPANPDRFLDHLARTYLTLALIHERDHDNPECVRLRKLAVEAFRKADPSPDNLKALAMALTLLAWAATDGRQIELAQTSIGEGERILRKLQAQDSAAYSESLAQALVVHAMVLNGMHDCDASARTLAEAVQLSSAEQIAGAARSVGAACTGAPQ